MIEILAPAGNEKCAYAAINSGANAIYLGLKDFSARSSAENFDMQSFKKICDYARFLGVKVYVAMNIAVKDGEVESFINRAVRVWNSGADAIICADMLLGKFLKEKVPEIVLHLSTQAGVINEYGARLAKSYGYSRVILARETSLEDVRKISEIIECEAFVQGALCSGFSGQCYFSSFIGGNSGNRGRCKQPCRKLYSIDKDGYEDLSYKICPSDLCVGEDIFSLIDAGVTSFKIEGRMRRPEYVSAAVKYYNTLLFGGDSAAAKSVLKRAYNRGGYTKGLAFGQDKTFLSLHAQGHIGEFAGVISVENKRYICKSEIQAKSGDGFKIFRSGKEVGGGVFGKSVRGGFEILSHAKLKCGDKAFITTDTSFSETLLSTRKLPVKLMLDFTAGNPPKAILNGTCFTGEKALETCKTSPLTQKDIENSFKKTDIYPIEPQFESIKVDNVFMQKSELNEFRRNCYKNFFEKSVQVSRQVRVDISPLKTHSASNKKVAVIAESLSGVKADIGILKLKNLNDDVLPLIQNFEGEKFLYLPPNLTGGEVSKYMEKAIFLGGIYTDNYFGLQLSKEFGLPLFAGTGFNILNRVSLLNCDAKYVSLSKELTIKEGEAISSINSFYFSGGDLKIMDLSYCPFSKKCANCSDKDIYTLKDEQGRAFKLRRYKAEECKFEVYNCVPLISGKNYGLFDFTLSGGHLSHYTNNLKDKFDCFTRGHSLNGIF